MFNLQISLCCELYLRVIPKCVSIFETINIYLQAPSSQQRISLQQFTNCIYFSITNYEVFSSGGFLNRTYYGKIVLFLKVSVFNVMLTTLVCLNVVHNGHAGPTGHYVSC
jgi:hypothetical protein